MRVVIIGGTGLIGGKLAGLLRGRGHDVVAASRSTGVDALTGEGVAGAVAGAQVVVDVSNVRPSGPDAVLDYFTRAGTTLLGAEAEAGVAHHIALTIVGADRMAESPYMKGKLAQEALIKAGRVPYTIVRATQFFEFLPAIADGGADGDTIRLPGVAFQPIAGDDVAAIVADVVESTPSDETVDIAGPDRAPMNELVALALTEQGDSRKVIADPAAKYFGAAVDDHSLVPLGEARIGSAHLAGWSRRLLSRTATIDPKPVAGTGNMKG
jgi:uncharacterized protein YbjT (DUF2867 family)